MKILSNQKLGCAIRVKGQSLTNCSRAYTNTVVQIGWLKGIKKRGLCGQILMGWLSSISRYSYIQCTNGYYTFMRHTTHIYTLYIGKSYMQISNRVSQREIIWAGMLSNYLQNLWVGTNSCLSIYIRKMTLRKHREIRALICICARLFEAFLMHTYIFMGTNKRKEKGASTIHYVYSSLSLCLV